MKQLRLLLLPMLVVTAAFGQQSPADVPADMVYARSGQLVDVGGYRLNLHCMGSGSPAVVFDSGWGDWSPAWSKVQPQIAKWTRACSYDRAGTGLSDPGPMPRTSVRIAGELRTALHQAGIAAPYILVASAFGSDNLRTFADLYTSEVAGLVLVDGDAVELEPRALQEDDHRAEAAFIPDIVHCRDLIAAHSALSVMPSRRGRPSQTCAERFFYRGLPESEWSPALNAEILQIAKTKVAMYDAYISEMREMPADELWLQQHRRSFGSRPIRILTSGNHGVGHLGAKPPDTPRHLQYERQSTLAQARWLTLSSDSKQIFVRDSSEYIQFDQPAAVINAIRSVYDRAKSAAAQQSLPPPRAMQIKAPDGTLLKGTYFAAAKPGPGVLLYHQSNRTRESWEGTARRLSAAGMNVLTVDSRGFGESGGRMDRQYWTQHWDGDLDVAFDNLISQPGVARDLIAVGGAGWLGVLDSVETARRHPASVRSLVLLSGETNLPQERFLRHASQLPALFVVSDDDEYPPTVEAMEWLYIQSPNPAKRLIHYSAAHDAPWLWFETSDAGKVAAHGAHGTDLFGTHPELPGIVVSWLATTLVEAPGHAPADAIASAALLMEIETPGGVARVTKELTEARRSDPKVQWWPEVSLDIIGGHHLREGETKAAVEIYNLNVLAYPDSADANSNLADAYLQAGQKDLARHYAERALAMIDSHAAPVSSWSDTEQRRDVVRRGVEDDLKKLKAGGTTMTSGIIPGGAFRDCPDCPQMVVVPAGRFFMGSSAAEKSWAANHGTTLGSVADEAPRHEVSVPSFAMGRYDVTRSEYAAFVRATGHTAGDGCGPDSYSWRKRPELTWQNPGFRQTDRDPAVCVSWQDANAYIAWLNGKVRRGSSASGDGPYRLPSESEWEYAARAGTSTRFWWGDDDAAAADHAWYKDNAGGHTDPVGLKAANAFGLYDMAGNVWQWTADCYAGSYSGAPADGGANETGVADPRPKGTHQCMRVDRGGSWHFQPWALRSATRERNPSDFRDTYMGFRLAKTL